MLPSLPLEMEISKLILMVKSGMSASVPSGTLHQRLWGQIRELASPAKILLTGQERRCTQLRLHYDERANAHKFRGLFLESPESFRVT